MVSQAAGTITQNKPQQGLMPLRGRVVDAPLELGGRTFILDELRESPVRRGIGFELPVALVLGSDVLSHFIVTIDIRAKKLILGVSKLAA